LIEQANSLNLYYSSVFCCECRISQIQYNNSCEPFTTSINIIRTRSAAIGKNKSVGPDSISGEILKLGGEAMILYLARLFDITINNTIIPSDWQKAIVVAIFKGVIIHWSQITDPSV
jgi:hypothetical protein